MLLKYKYICMVSLQIACICFCFSALSATEFPENVFRTSYTCHDLRGNYRWDAVTEIYSSPEKGEGVNTLSERGKGVYSGFKDLISWQSELKYRKVSGQVRPVKSRTEIFSDPGELIVIESQDFDHNSGTVTFTREDIKSGKISSEVFTIKEDIVNRLMLGLYIQQFLKSGKDEAFLEILNSEPRLIRCRLYIIGKEEIEIAGIKRDAIKLCLDPQMGLFSFVKVFIPKSYVWHSAEGEFEWLKYHGLELNLNSPIVEITNKG